MSKKGGKNMPRRNGTGPLGQGAMTGRGMGPCNGQRTNYARGYGRGMGMGNGLGRSNFYATPTKEDLQVEKENLQRRIEEINKTLE